MEYVPPNCAITVPLNPEILQSCLVQNQSRPSSSRLLRSLFMTGPGPGADEGGGILPGAKCGGGNCPGGKGAAVPGGAPATPGGGMNGGMPGGGKGAPAGKPGGGKGAPAVPGGGGPPMPGGSPIGGAPGKPGTPGGGGPPAPGLKNIGGGGRGGSPLGPSSPSLSGGIPGIPGGIPGKLLGRPYGLNPPPSIIIWGGQEWSMMVNNYRSNIKLTRFVDNNEKRNRKRKRLTWHREWLRVTRVFCWHDYHE